MAIKPETIRKIKEARELFVSHPEGKMHDIPAITESCLCNPFCEKMSKDAANVCSKCYARNGLGFEQAAALHYARNTELLSRSEIPDYYLPRFYTDVARFETHGDWVNLQSALNEIKIARFNPMTHFTVWTKRVDILRQLAEAGVQQPANFHVKVSSPLLNQCLPQTVKEELAKNGWHISYFTVLSLDALLEKYGKEYLQQHGDQVITCGGRDCRNCMRCYGDHPMEDVVELLKQDAAKARRLGIKIA